ncbi:C_GCAxxG_C_C family protein [Candidatus Poribacteria bacterium]|nr:C_GCAxxG_C_C family protein [Candidatus Poribacteria bacterium]
MQDLLGLGDTKKLLSVAGLAGGIGHQGAACGILVSGALSLGLASARAEEDQATIIARGCMRADEYVRRFKKESCGALCKEITGTNFDDDAQLRRYIISKSRACVKLASKATAIMCDIIEQPHHEVDEFYLTLNRAFADNNFNCAHSVSTLVSEELGMPPTLSLNMLMPLNGGIGYSGLTCAALIGGCMAIGTAQGGDTSQTGAFRVLARILLTLIQGKKAFNRLDLSPANDALLRCAELSKWFEKKFGSRACRDIIKIDFHDKRRSQEFFDRKVISKCISVAKETATKAAELAR